MGLLQSLTEYERGKIAEALEEEKYEAGDAVVRQGEQGDAVSAALHSMSQKRWSTIMMLNTTSALDVRGQGR